MSQGLKNQKNVFALIILSLVDAKTRFKNYNSVAFLEHHYSTTVVIVRA